METLVTMQELMWHHQSVSKLFSFLFYFTLKPFHHHHHQVVLRSQIPLILSHHPFLLASSPDDNQNPHCVDKYRSLSVSQHWYIPVCEPTMSLMSSSLFLQREVSGHIAAVLWGYASRIRSKQNFLKFQVVQLCNSTNMATAIKNSHLFYQRD